MGVFNFIAYVIYSSASLSRLRTSIVMKHNCWNNEGKVNVKNSVDKFKQYKLYYITFYNNLNTILGFDQLIFRYRLVPVNDQIRHHFDPWFWFSTSDFALE